MQLVWAVLHDSALDSTTMLASTAGDCSKRAACMLCGHCEGVTVHVLCIASCFVVVRDAGETSIEACSWATWQSMPRSPTCWFTCCNFHRYGGCNSFAAVALAMGRAVVTVSQQTTNKHVLNPREHWWLHSICSHHLAARQAAGKAADVKYLVTHPALDTQYAQQALLQNPVLAVIKTMQTVQQCAKQSYAARAA